MHQIKRDAYVMKDALLHNDLHTFSNTLGRSWEAKKRTASGITNAEINRIHDLAIAAGALSGKVSGAGGGGFLFFIVAPERRPHLLKTLAREPGATCVAASPRRAHRLGASDPAWLTRGPGQLLLALASLRHALQDRLGIQHSLLLTPLVVVPHQGMLRTPTASRRRQRDRRPSATQDRAHRGRSIGKGVQF